MTPISGVSRSTPSALNAYAAADPARRSPAPARTPRDRVDTDPLRGVQTVGVAKRRQVAVEWHHASLHMVHKLIDPATNRTILQLPAAQVLNVLADLMGDIRSQVGE